MLWLLLLLLLLVMVLVCWWFHFVTAKWILCIGLFPFIIGIGWHHSTERLLLEFILFYAMNRMDLLYIYGTSVGMGKREAKIWISFIVRYDRLRRFFYYVSFCLMISISIYTSSSFFSLSNFFLFLPFVSSLNVILNQCVYVPFCFYCRRNLRFTFIDF